MEKNQKGFTLIEVLGVIVIIAVVVSITTVVINNVIKRSNENAWELTRGNIEKAAETYVLEFGSELEFNDENEYVTITLKQLIENGYLKKNIKNPVTKETLDELDYDIYIEVYRDDNGTILADYKEEFNQDDSNEYIIKKLVDVLTDENLDNAKWERPTGDIYQSMSYIVDTDTTNSTQPNNFVWYSGHLWRVFKKDSENNLYMVTDNSVSTFAWRYNSGWNDSYAKQWLEEVFYPTLAKKQIIHNDAIYDITKYEGSSDSYLPSGETKTVINKIGLLSVADYEAISNSLENKDNYINNLTHLYLMNDYSITHQMGLNSSGFIKTYLKAYGEGSYKPVIKINKNVLSVGGSGTIKNPYIIDCSNSSTRLKDKIVGEYVKFDDRIWRIQEKTSEGLKLIANFRNSHILRSFGSNNDFEESDIKTYLNTIGNVISSDNYNKLVESTYFLGKYGAIGSSNDDTWVSYNTTKETNTTGDLSYGISKVKVGLPRIGEMFTSKDIRSITSGKIIGYYYFTLTPRFSYAHIYSISSNGYLSSLTLDQTRYIRPTITLNKNTTIKSGTGTLFDPYELD